MALTKEKIEYIRKHFVGYVAEKHMLTAMLQKFNLSISNNEQTNIDTLQKFIETILKSKEAEDDASPCSRI